MCIRDRLGSQSFGISSSHAVSRKLTGSAGLAGAVAGGLAGSRSPILYSDLRVAGAPACAAVALLSPQAPSSNVDANSRVWGQSPVMVESVFMFSGFR